MPLSCFHAHRTCSPVSLPTGSALVCSPGEVQGLLALLCARAGEGRDQFSCSIPGPALLPAACGKG